MKLSQFDVVKVSVSFAEDRSKEKSRWAIVIQQDGELIQLVWATSQQVDASSPQPGEFCVTDARELTAMGHTKASRYSFRRGGVIVVKQSEITAIVGHAPKTVVERFVRALRTA